MALPNVSITVRAITARSAKSTWAIPALVMRKAVLAVIALRENKQKFLGKVVRFLGNGRFFLRYRFQSLDFYRNRAYNVYNNFFPLEA